MKKLLYHFIAIIMAMIFTIAFIACGGGGKGDVSVTSVTVTPSMATISVGGTRQLTANVLPADATNKNVTWTSSNGNVTLAPNGLAATVTGVTLGSATITVTTQDGGKTASCNVNVSDVAEPVVYVAGTINVPFAMVAAYWKDAERKDLVPQEYIDGYVYSEGNSIFVDDTGNVYVAGRHDYHPDADWTNNAVLWKNDFAGMQILAWGSNTADNHWTDEFAYSVFVSGGTVYVAGTAEVFDWDTLRNYYVPRLYTNGTQATLSSDSGNAEALSVFVSGGAAYVAGTDYSNTTSYAACWDGSSRSYMPGNTPAWGNAVYVSGADKYICGAARNGGVRQATVWKNGSVLFTYPNPSGYDYGWAHSIYVDGNDVYAAVEYGNDDASTAVVMKNGDALHQLVPATSNGYPTSIYVFNGVVYVAGTEEMAGGTWRATLWVDSQAIRLDVGDNAVNSIANSVFVKN